MKPYIIDTTLRDGEQKPGLVFADHDRERMAMELDLAGVREIEAGIPAMGDEAIQRIRQLGRLPIAARLSVWCRASLWDIRQAIRCEVPVLHLSVPGSDILLKSLHKDRLWLYQTLETCLGYARGHFDYISVGVQDVSRMSLVDLECLANAAYLAGANRLRLADSVGVWNPFQTYEVIHDLAGKYPDLELGFHGHNDLGMAVANSVAAFRGGAHSVDCTVLGLGERAGNAPLEEVALAVEMTEGIATGIQLNQLNGLCRLVAFLADVTIPETKPIAGDAIFHHESGIHVQAILSDPDTYEPFRPDKVGHAARQVVIGRHSGTASVQYVMSQMGCPIDRSMAQRLLDFIRVQTSHAHPALTPEELFTYYQKISVVSA